ncbi:glycoside hydrolase family 20 zincin-like fold domain-containing protein [Acidobacteria bacterium AH-259-O06]|nr:glycoside hydrolase family 20 zincin-like fold domain-containing protein [Acidobacteria bacterium AH-259-O06]
MANHLARIMVWILCCAFTLATSSASYRVIPTPHFLRSGSDTLNIPRDQPGGARVVVPEAAGKMFLIAAELLENEANRVAGVKLELSHRLDCAQKPCILLVDWSRKASKSADVERLLSPEDLRVLSDSKETGQAYVLKSDINSNRVLLVGSSPLGVLYAATTLIQLWSGNSHGLAVPDVHVRDYPDFKYRSASDWLLRAELNRWAYDWGDGKRAFVQRIKRKLDFCLRFKINMVLFDGFAWNPERVPGYGAMMRELNAYARERGIKLVFSGFGANFDPKKVEPEFNIGRVYLNRRNYPYGAVYSCFGELRTPLHPTLGTCRANEELNAQIAQAIKDFVRTVEPGALYIHHEDTGHFDRTQERWRNRDELCRARWPNDDFAARDGGAGAMAYRYSKIVEAVQQVRNPDSGYEAVRDCTIILISPPYGIDSGRSGLGPDPTDEELNWNKTLEFWANAVALLPSDKNVEIGFREIFPRTSTGQSWLEAYTQKLGSLGLNSKVFLFFLGGADQYSSGVFNYPYAGTPVMNGIFKGAEAIYNFSGGLHQEPLQVLNAQFSWNADAPGNRQPKTFKATLAAWNALRSNEELPAEIFGPGGLFEEACVKIYGPAAGKSMARLFHYFEPSSAKTLPSFYPRKIYSLAVLWRIFQADSRYWRFELDSDIRQTLKSLQIDYGELQRRLSTFWFQSAEVNEKAKIMVTEARNATDLYEDARADLKHLSRCLDVGTHFSRLLASYHQVIAEHFSGTANEQQVDKNLAQVNQLWDYLRSNFPFDTVDPKGGDLSSWTLTLRELRNNLIAFAQSHARPASEFR